MLKRKNGTISSLLNTIAALGIWPALLNDCWSPAQTDAESKKQWKRIKRRERMCEKEASFLQLCKTLPYKCHKLCAKCFMLRKYWELRHYSAITDWKIYTDEMCFYTLFYFWKIKHTLYFRMTCVTATICTHWLCFTALLCHYFHFSQHSMSHETQNTYLLSKQDTRQYCFQILLHHLEWHEMIIQILNKISRGTSSNYLRS